MSAVYSKIAAVSAELRRLGLPKDQKNQAQGFNFRGIDQLMIILSPILVDAGLLIIPRHLNRTSTEKPTKSGGVQFFAVIEAEFDFIAVEDGSLHTAKMFGEGMDSADKATAKAASAAYKNVCFQVFCIPVKSIPDGDNDDDPHIKTTPKPIEEKFFDEIPEYAGDWRECVVHVGKQSSGKFLGDLPPDQGNYLMENYKPKKGPNGYKAQDALLRAALNAAAAEQDQ